MKRLHAGSGRPHKLLEAAVPQVPEEEAGRLVVLAHFRVDSAGHLEYIRPAVVIEIRDAHAPGDIPRFDPQAGADRRVAKLALAVVEIHHRSVVREMRLHDMELPVQPQVADRHPHTGLHHPVLAQGDAALDRLFAERAIVIVAEQQARRGVAGDVNVRPALVVEIRSHYRQSIAAFDLADAASLRDVGEDAFPVIPIKAVLAVREAARAAKDAFDVAALGGARTRNRFYV